MIFNAVFLAIRQISRNYLRAFLTMLGVIIGVGAVIIMINLGNGTQTMIKEAIESLGSNLLMIHAPPHLNPSGTSKSRNFTMKEVETIEDRVPGIRAIAPTNVSSVVAKYMNKNVQTSVSGVTAGYFTAVDWNIAEGRSFENKEYVAGTNTCVIGESVRKNLLGQTSPIGARLKVGSVVCDVVGVLESKGQGGRGNDQDDVILMPLKAFQRSISPSDSIYNIKTIMVSLNEDVDYKVASGQIAVILRHMRNIPDKSKDTFEIQSTKEIQQTVEKSIGGMTVFIGAVAGVSLLVGGIGIMNIMLVSVTERTREIGTRLAIGALEKEVLLQFLVESATISAVGGLIGVIFGFLMTLLLSAKLHIPFTFDVKIAAVSFIFSGLIGVIFGYLPARKASRLNPIDALHHE